MNNPAGPSGKTQGFPRSRRVTQRRDFLRIQQGGQRVTTTHFVLIVAPGVLGSARLGITASKQVGNAVQRARCKRLVREVFRRDTGLLPAGVDLVVIVRSGADKLDLGAVMAEWAGVRSVLGRRAAAVLRGKTLSAPWRGGVSVADWACPWLSRCCSP